MEFQRSHLKILKKRLENEPRRFIQVIYGPRQVGKTTLVTQFKNNTTIPSLMASADGLSGTKDLWINQQWEKARWEHKNGGGNTFILILDEIQKIDNWSEQIKKEWDQDTLSGINIKLVLLGSSRLLLMEGLTESLAGRFEATYLSHWSFTEMHEAFGLSPDEYIWFGGYPGAATLFQEEERWKAYLLDSLIETSIAKDILMMTRVDKPALMRRLFELGCQYSGQILSYNKILGQLIDAGNTTTLAHYLQLLGGAGLLSGLEKYNPKKLRQRASSPKLQVHNTALMSAIELKPFEKISEDQTVWGRWVESGIGAHLLQATYSSPLRLYYWREGNDEVDFVLEYNDKVIGIEVKSGKSNLGKGIQTFRDKFRPYKVFIAGEGGIPWKEFLTISPVELFR